MSDSELQRLERAWRASGSVADEAAYLRERMRVGELAQGQLELAAWCGHPAACLLVQTPQQTRTAAELSELARFGAGWLLRAVFLVLEHSIETRFAEVDAVTQACVLDCRELLVAWLREPLPAQGRAARILAGSAEERLEILDGLPPWTVPPQAAQGRATITLLMATLSVASALGVSPRPSESDALVVRLSSDALNHLLQISTLGVEGVLRELARHALFAHE